MPCPNLLVVRSRPRFRKLSAVLCLALPGALLLLSGCKRDPNAVAEREYADAQQSLKENKTDAAVIQLSRAIQAKPEMAKAHHDLAKIYLDRADINGAFREYSLAIRYNPQDRDAYYALGEILLRAREFTKAKDIATQVLSNWPEDRLGKSFFVEAQMGSGDYDGARKMVDQNAREAPQDSRAQFDLATLYVHDKKWSEAESQLRLSWSLDPKTAIFPLYLAQLLEFQNNHKGAEDVLQRAIADQPQRTDLLFALASLYIHQQRLSDAEQVFKKIQLLDSKDARSRVGLGEFYLATHNLAAAEAEFRRLTSQDPSDAVSWHHLADVEVALNRRDEARRIANDLLKKDAKDWQSLALLGRLDLDEGKTAPAEKELDQAKTLKPDSPVVQFQLARLYLAQNKPDRARLALGESLHHAPNYAPSLILQAALEMRAGQSDLAVQDLTSALKQAPAALEPNLMISQAYVQRGDYNLAEETLQRLMDQPNSPANMAMVLQTLADVRFRQGRYAEAATLATKSLNTGLLSLDGLRVLGMSYLAQKRPDLAIQSVKQFADKADHWALGQEALGEIALQAKRLDIAEAAYQKALQIQPDFPGAVFGLGDTYDRGQQFAKAEQYFTRFAELQPSNATVHLRLGVLAERNQDWTRAASEYQTTINLDSSNAVAKNNLAWVYAQHNGDLNVALRLAQEARAILPDDPSVADTLGWIFVKKNLGANALPYLRECVKKSPGNAVYHYHLGLAYALTGKKVEAKSELHTALRSGSSFPNAADAQKALDDLTKSD